MKTTFTVAAIITTLIIIIVTSTNPGYSHRGSARASDTGGEPTEITESK